MVGMKIQTRKVWKSRIRHTEPMAVAMAVTFDYLRAALAELDHAEADDVRREVARFLWKLAEKHASRA
jgi:hypothetical protein